MNTPTIGIIGGTGLYGQWWKSFFQKQGIKVLIAGRKTAITKEELIKQSDIVIICVPIRNTVEAIEKVAPLMRPDQLLCDFTSLKVEPLKAMLKAKSGVSGIHPLFGPLIKDIKNEQVVFCSARDNEWTVWFKNLLSLNGAKIIETTPEEHDHQMAMIQALTHLSNIVFAQTIFSQKQKPSALYATPVFRLQKLLMGRILAQNADLYADIEIENPEFLKLLNDYNVNFNHFYDLVAKKDYPGFVFEFKKIAEYLDDFIVQATEKSGQLLQFLEDDKDASELNDEIQAAASQKIGYLGPVGTFSHQAASNVFRGKNDELMPQKSIAEVFESVLNGHVNYGLVPVENSSTGLVSETVLSFIEYPLFVNGSYDLSIHNYLLARTEDKNQIKIIKSHVQPLGQCRHYLQTNFPNIPTESYPSTVAAILSDADETTAFIGPQKASIEYGLKILDSEIEDRKGNTTKFYLISKNLNNKAPDLNTNHTVLLVAVHDRVGVLHDILSVFLANGLNLTRLHSIPSNLKNWDYYFFLEVDAPLASPKLDAALKGIAPHCTTIRVLGCA